MFGHTAYMNQIKKISYMNKDCVNKFYFIKDDTFSDDEDDEESTEDYDETKIQKNQNYFCFIDPTKILLQNVNREFLGNYSCRGYNAAGWGHASEQKLLDVFYEPGNASLTVSPPIPLKRKTMTLKCTVDDKGNPPSTRFYWLRGDKPVKDVDSSEWIIHPVSLEMRNNFSCFATNAGGNGTMATINVEVQVAPTFITSLGPYSGFLYSEPNINLTCRVECVPRCSIYWFREGEEITNLDERYYIKEVARPADTARGDFESVLSVLVSEKFCIYFF